MASERRGIVAWDRVGVRLHEHVDEEREGGSDGRVGRNRAHAAILPDPPAPAGGATPGRGVAPPVLVKASTRQGRRSTEISGGTLQHVDMTLTKLTLIGALSSLALAVPAGAGTRSSSDPDHDGLSTAVEQKAGLNPRSADSDHDCVPDGAEDLDRDGVDNDNEVAEGTSLTRADTDRDGVRDGAEDADRDHLSNKREDEFGEDPTVKDTDHDGIGDAREDDDRDGRANAVDTRDDDGEADEDDERSCAAVGDRDRVTRGEDPRDDDTAADDDDDAAEHAGGDDD